MFFLGVVFRGVLALLLSAILLAVLAVVGVSFYVLPGLPPIDKLEDPYHVPLRVYAADGSLIAEFGEKRREPLELDEIPEKLKQAVIAAEDGRFYVHSGVDYQGLMRAVVNMASTGSATQGGSTLTMQLARSYFLTQERTFSRKLREIFLAFKIEKRLSKDEILARYLNRNYMGNRAYGVGAASHTYYGTELEQLTLPQIAMLAGLYKAPSRYNPLANSKQRLERARLRRNYVLRRMYEDGYITQEEARNAQQATLTAAQHFPVPEVEAPYVAEMVRSELYKQYGDEVYSKGFHVITTIDKQLQEVGNKALRKTLLAYDRRHGYRGVEGHYDLTELDSIKADDDQTLSLARLDHMDDWLAHHPSHGDVNAALVLEVSKNNASLYLGSGEYSELPLSRASWARKYIDADRRGKKPTDLTRLFKPGDLIRVLETEEGIELSQLPEINGALVSLSSEDGRIISLVGGFDYYYSPFNRVTQAERQPGSCFKPFVYSAALDHGMTPASVFNDAPVVHMTYIDGKRAAWRPQNYTGRFYGPTRMRVALAKSRNLVSIRVLERTGLTRTVKHIEKFGMTNKKIPKNLSLALGTLDITPLQLASGYAVFSNGGYRVEPYFISKVTDMFGNTERETVPVVACKAPCNNLITPEKLRVEPDLVREGKRLGKPANQVVESDNVFQMVSMMQDVVRSGTASRAWREMKRKDIAGKTGTTNDQKDAWFSGFTKEIVTTVWTGFDHPKPLGNKEVGGRVALPVWIDFMKVALEDKPEDTWDKPAGMITVKIDKDTGFRADEYSERTVFETFRPGHTPREGVATMAPIEGVEVPEQIF